MMRFRRDRFPIDGLSERDAARLESFLRHPSTTPGMEGLAPGGPLAPPSGTRVGDEGAETVAPIPGKKRGRRVS